MKIISNGEGVSIEFKECKTSVPKSAFETICAFLNRHGGDLFFGVADDGTITGIDKASLAQIKKDFVSSLNNPQKISPTVYLSVEEYIIDNKAILHIFVPESSQVHKCNNKIYDRNEDGDFDVTNSSDIVANMYIRKQNIYTENTIYPYATMEDLRSDLIDRV